MSRVLVIIGLLLFNSMTVNAQTWENVKSFFTMGEASKLAEPAKIKVLIQPLIDGVLLDIKGAYNIYDPLNKQRLGTRFFGKSRFIQAREGGLRWGEEFPGIFQLVFVPDRPDTTTLINGIEYKGVIFVYQIGNDKISIVNEIDIEDYIKSVLGAQFDEALLPETMAALAIVARTDAYYYRSKNLDKFWHITASQAGYKGFAVTHKNNGVDDAVDMTRYLVMNDVVDGSVFPARWTEHSGGKTVAFQTLFRKSVPGPKVSVEAPFAALNREETKWSCSVAIEDLARLAKLDKITDMQIFRDKESSKVYAIRFQDILQSSDVDFLSLQEDLGEDLLQSSEFTVDREGDRVIFSGYGKGHGVGLCVYSAEKMVEKGNDAAKVLRSFFPEVLLKLEPEVLLKPSSKPTELVKKRKKVNSDSY